MERSAIETVKACSEAFADGGVAGTAPFLADDLRWFPGRPRDEIAVRGKDAYLAYHAAREAEHETIDVVHSRLTDLGGGRVLVGGELVVDGPDGRTSQEMFWLMSVEDGVIVAIAAHPTEREALSSVGIGFRTDG